MTTMKSLLDLMPSPTRGNQVLSSVIFKTLRNNSLSLIDLVKALKDTKVSLICCHCNRNYISRYAVIIDGVAIIRPNSQSASAFHTLFKRRLSEYTDIGWEEFHKQINCNLVQYCVD